MLENLIFSRYNNVFQDLEQNILNINTQIIFEISKIHKASSTPFATTSSSAMKSILPLHWVRITDWTRVKGMVITKLKRILVCLSTSSIKLKNKTSDSFNIWTLQQI